MRHLETFLADIDAAALGVSRLSPLVDDGVDAFSHVYALAALGARSTWLAFERALAACLRDGKRYATPEDVSQMPCAEALRAARIVLGGAVGRIVRKMTYAMHGEERDALGWGHTFDLFAAEYGFDRATMMSMTLSQIELYAKAMRKRHGDASSRDITRHASARETDVILDERDGPVPWRMAFNIRKRSASTIRQSDPRVWKMHMDGVRRYRELTRKRMKT